MPEEVSPDRFYEEMHEHPMATAHEVEGQTRTVQWFDFDGNKLGMIRLDEDGFPKYYLEGA